VTILDEILAHKRDEVARAKRGLPPAELAALARAATDPTRGFRAALLRAPRPRIVAEIKRRSPSRGEIRSDFDPVACAKAYADSGAAALSVLTDERYFGGRLDTLGLARRSVALPILRKDFVVDAYQIDEARHFGADAVLLIAAAFGLCMSVPIKLVVVVLPCVPATAMPHRRRMSSASIRARGIVGMCLERAQLSSGFSGFIAEE
jgi:indole-3-glycerol phosphate synthase